MICVGNYSFQGWGWIGGQIDIMSKILQPYEVAVVHSDVEAADTLGDLLYSLQRLSGTVDDVFSRIEKKVTDERNRVAQINSRVGACQSKVQLVRGSNRATTVFSTSKFPAPKDLPLCDTLFSEIKEVSIST